jgi:hypothetical protein
LFIPPKPRNDPWIFVEWRKLALEHVENVVQTCDIFSPFLNINDFWEERRYLRLATNGEIDTVCNFEEQIQ